MNLSKLPKKLSISGRTVKVNTRNLVYDSNNMGEASYSPPMITLDNGVPPAMILEVLMHEVLHQIDEAHGGRFDLDEGKVKTLAIALAPVIEQLRRYL